MAMLSSFTGLRSNRITNRAPSPRRPSGSPTTATSSVTQSQYVNCAIRTSTQNSPPNHRCPSSQNSTPRAPQNPKTQLSLLIESNQRIEQALREIQTSDSSRTLKRQRERVPKELSGLLHEVYRQLKEQEDPVEWDLTSSFDANASVNAVILSNVQGLQTNSDYSAVIIRRAMRIYFRTLKARQVRTSRGKQAETIMKQRRRQRMINKANSRKRALNQSSSVDKSTKKKIEAILKPEYMSSDESVVSSEEILTADENDELSLHSSRKKLRKKVLSWRSEELQTIISSLDRKLSRKRNLRAKAMVLETEIGETSSREAPLDCPDWAMTVFD